MRPKPKQRHNTLHGDPVTLIGKTHNDQIREISDKLMERRSVAIWGLHGTG
jgi:hypothetical protein